MVVPSLVEDLSARGLSLPDSTSLWLMALAILLLVVVEVSSERLRYVGLDWLLILWLSICSIGLYFNI